jgi:hypothetical protein
VIATLAWLLIATAGAALAGMVAVIIMNARRIRMTRARRAALRQRQAPPAIPQRRRTDPLPDSLCHGRDRLVVIARRRPR